MKASEMNIEMHLLGIRLRNVFLIILEEKKATNEKTDIPCQMKVFFFFSLNYFINVETGGAVHSLQKRYN